MWNFQSILTVAVLGFVYFCVITEKLDRMKAAFFGGALLLVFGVSSLHEAWTQYIDFETIGLLTGMMLIAGVIGQTGLFQFVALRAVKLTKGRFGLLLIALSIVTALFSAFLDNVTTILLLAPVGIFAADALHRRPYLLLMAMGLSANIGGAATLIGDPPNMLIGSAAGLSFGQFMSNLGPMAIIALVVTLIYVFFTNRKELKPTGETIATDSFDEKKYLKDRPTLYISLAVLGLVIVSFMVLPSFGIGTAEIALAGGALLLLINKGESEKLLQLVEWPLIFFFLGLFVITGTLEKVGLVEIVGRFFASLTDSPFLLSVILLWLGTFGAAMLSAVPFVAVMIPIVATAISHLGLDPATAEPLWWSLALGVCIGGNGSLVGSAANLTLAGISQRTREPLTYGKFFRLGMPTVIVVQIFSTAYIYLRYFAFA
jgi:Na+/H+ antiporter NhaD/arsenite permease-like protein